MWIRTLGLTALLSFAPFLGAKDKPIFPRLIVNARYVLVTTYFGDEPANVRVTPADRQAAADVENAIRKWGRYTVVYERKNADLIFLIRKGRIAEVQPGISIHAGSQKPTPGQERPNSGVAPILVGDAGDPEDMLAVYDAGLGIDNSPLWRSREADGLNPPEMSLIKELRTKVEAAAKTP